MCIRDSHMTRRWCMEHSNVRLVSTTEDPVDDLHCHIALQKEKMFTRVITEMCIRDRVRSM